MPFMLAIAFCIFSMPGIFMPVGLAIAEPISLEAAAFWNAMYSAAPGTSFATHIEPTMFIFMSFIIAAASGGICPPPISDMAMDDVKAYSSQLMPSITCDLPVGLIEASTLGGAAFGGTVPAGAPVPAADPAGETEVAVFWSGRRMITCLGRRSVNGD